MKKLLFLISLWLCINLQAADIYVNSFGTPNSFPTLALAINAANDGDRILVSDLTTLNETDTIDKSLTIISQVSGQRVDFTGDIYIKANSSIEIRIIGFLIKGGSIIALNGTANEINKCNFYLIDSEFEYSSSFTSSSPNLLNFDIPGLSANILFCSADQFDVKFRNGQLIGSNFRNFFIEEGSNFNYNDTIKIIANYFSGGNIGSIVNNEDHYFYIANNFFKNTLLEINKNVSSGIGNNLILNNCFTNSHRLYGTNLVFKDGFSHNKTIVKNNEFDRTSYCLNQNWSCYSSQDYLRKNIGTGSTNSLQSSYNPFIQYNYFDYNSNRYGANGVVLDSLNYFQGGIPSYDYSSSNNGDPGIEYYDIDLTRNNIGPNGGYNCWFNYRGSSFSQNYTYVSGGTRIYNLELPSRVFNGQANVRAKAVHGK
jgi:hypothetical protein